MKTDPSVMQQKQDQARRTRVQASPETVRCVVRNFDHLFLRLELRDREHRPEDLLADLLWVQMIRQYDS